MIEIERKLLAEFETLKQPKPSERAIRINKLQKKLKDMEEVIIPTDKTNSFKVILLQDYKRWVLETLETDAREIELKKLTETLKKAEQLLMEIDPIISPNEFYFVKDFLKTRAIPTPKLLIKDHKDPNDDGSYPTRLIVPATNFTAAFPKLGYLGIKNIFDTAGINYTRKTIV